MQPTFEEIVDFAVLVAAASDEMLRGRRGDVAVVIGKRAHTLTLRDGGVTISGQFMRLTPGPFEEVLCREIFRARPPAYFDYAYRHVRIGERSGNIRVRAATSQWWLLNHAIVNVGDLACKERVVVYPYQFKEL